MNMRILRIRAFLFSNYSISQLEFRGLKVTTFKNDTDKLTDNYVVDMNYVRITNSQYSIDSATIYNRFPQSLST